MSDKLKLMREAAAAKTATTSKPEISLENSVTHETYEKAQQQMRSTARQYLLPSAPSSFIMSSGRRINAPDGVITTSDPGLIAELEKAVEVGNVYRYTGKVMTKQQLIPGSDES